jgi:hypothetical protein
MNGRNRISLKSLAGAFTLVLALALVFSCSEQPTAIDQGDSGGLSGRGNIEPGTEGSFLLGAVSDSTVAPGYIEVWGMKVAYDSVEGVVSFDALLLNRTARTIPAPIHFVVTDIMPRDIAVLGFDGTSADGFPFFDFSSKLGGDNVLTPGESTGPVTVRFHTVTARSFAIGFRIDLGGPGGPGIIAGVVYRDDNKNGIRDRCDRCEPGIPGITVALEKPLRNGDWVTLITRTGSDGAYSFGGLGAGVFKVFVVAPEDRWEVTSTNPLLVTLVKGPDGIVQNFLGANFGLFPLLPPIPDNLFGPILVGPFSHYGTTLDSTFANPPSLLPVVYHYYLEVTEPPFEGPFPIVIDAASAWINNVQVFSYFREFPPDSAYFAPQTIELPDSLVKIGENGIRLFTDGNEYAALLWRVYRTPSPRTP